MPLYEYVCEKHGVFERLQNMSESKELNCPDCGLSSKRKISIPRRPKMAVPFAVLDADGNVLHMRQTTEKLPPAGYRHENENLVEA